MSRRLFPFAPPLLALLVITSAHSQEKGAEEWLRAMSMTRPAPADTLKDTCARALDFPEVKVTPPTQGTHMVRVSVPLPQNALGADLSSSRIELECTGVTGDLSDLSDPTDRSEIIPDFRILTLHPTAPPSVRRLLMTFPFEFSDTSPRAFRLLHLPGAVPAPVLGKEAPPAFTLDEVSVSIEPTGVTVSYAKGAQWTTRLIAPTLSAQEKVVCERVEHGQHYAWYRLLIPDKKWPRIIEVKVDSLGVVAVQAHLQRMHKGDGTAPDFGWEISGPAMQDGPEHQFSGGEPCTLSSSDGTYAVEFPSAPFYRRGKESTSNASGQGTIRYLRFTEGEKVPFQEAAWRRADFVIGPKGHTPRNALLEPAVQCRVSSEMYGATDADLVLWPVLDDLRTYTRGAICSAMILGDDFGNVTAFSEGNPASVFGMNRLNHCPVVFREAWRSGNRRLLDTALLWCSNMYDLSIWWGQDKDFGGTRYNNVNAAGKKDHLDDRSFMWRSNDAVHFCTKGYDAFLLAYEETGDPRMLTALNAQVEYARKHVHANQGECRNIGDVADFMNLYRMTGIVSYREEALRLFTELREKLMDTNLFSQGGQPIAADSPFIDDDQHGYEAPFAKPYIIGYALAGLPDLLRAYPDEARLRGVIRAVADFLAESQDPVGGWRYPHPRSSFMILDQSMEHAAQITRAAAVLEERGEPIDNLLDAIERTLQARVCTFARTGTILSSLTGWETSTGALKEGKTIYDLYKKPADRDASRDYTEGTVGTGGSCPEGIVYFAEVLEFYAAHRPLERLFSASETLAKVVSRAPDRRIKLTPQEKGSYVRMESPENPEAAFTLWAPEWVNFPNLGYSEQELGGMAIDWKRDEATGAVSYTADREDATLRACFTPHREYVECAYTVWPKKPTDLPPTFAVGPCQQMKGGLFECDDADLMNRLMFLSNGQWTSVGSCANGNSRNVLYIEGRDSPEMSGAMAESGWKTIQSPRPSLPLIACVSRDAKWVAAAAAEHSDSLCNNANASHRCIHAQASMPLRQDGPTTLRVNVYLFQGTLQDLEAQYRRHVSRWSHVEPAPSSVDRGADTYGMRADLPSIHDVQVKRLRFPLAWENAGLPFDEWRTKARESLIDALGPRPPLAPFAPTVLAVEDRETYEARKIVVNLSSDTRVKAYLLVPKGKGPFPAMIALHDHGAHFSIGKEKVVRPFDEPKGRIKDAEEWVGKCYSGRYIGDELAKRGYVVFATDALFWGDRGRQEGVEYTAQQALAANMTQLGLSWAGRILWDDIRSAEFVQGLPDVDPDLIGCVGLSMGCSRTWHLAAATDIVKAGLAICWMGDTPTLMREGNNQTKGQSAFSMIHPGLRNLLDYPDVASIACPKPMLFYNGEKDGLFPVPGVQAAYERMRKVWRDRNVETRLETRLWPVPHEFNAKMQRAAFDWLDKNLRE